VAKTVELLPSQLKAGVNHVRPSSEIVSRMLAIRIHLDECGVENGPLRVIPGSHKHGFLSDQQIQDWPKSKAVTCTANRGDVILMRPLLLHGSPPATVPSSRRVIHLEFAAEELPKGVEWKIDLVAGTLRAMHPDFRYQPIAEPEELGNAGRVKWVEGRPNEAPAVAGTDFILARDGRIAAVYLFFDKLP
jgi:ectoine hydroxylase-related dioxygenase (phytanoyl-CoA dioxygenase family)